MADDFQAVARMLATYFDGLYFSDTARLRAVFHDRAHYICASDGTLLYRTMAEYFPIVDAREPPAKRGEVRRDEIVSIEFAGPVTAFARVRCAVAEKLFTDLLTLVCLDGQWRIVSKVFHYDIQQS